MLGLLLAVAVASSPAPEPTPTGEQIYLRGISAMRALPRPKVVTFRESYVGTNVRPQCGDSDDGDFDIDPLHRGNFSATYEVHSENAGRHVVARDLSSGDTCDARDFFKAFPGDFDVFGAKKSGPDSNGTNLNGLKVIGSVTSYASTRYFITLVDRETLDNHNVYRLSLKPRGDADDYPLRSMLVDADSFVIRRINAEFYERESIGAGRGSAEVDFDQVGKYWVTTKTDIRVRIAIAFFIRRDFSLVLNTSDFSFP